LLLFTLALQPSTLLAQGSLTPPGAPAPTMKTLQQVEPRVPISSAPFTISQPGSYYLTTNLTVSGGNAITIATNGVTLDLNGFTISSTTNPASGTAVLIGSGLRNIAIQNGHIQGGVTNNGSGVFSGPGFGYGIFYSGSAPQNVRVSGVSVSGCQYHGIYVGNSGSTTVENCVVRTVGGRGIFANTIRGCVALDCGSTAIYGEQVSDSRGESVGSGTGLYAGTAQNCYGYSSSSGYGLYAYNALNCYGSSGSGTGLYASGTAIGCYGQSSSGPRGLYAQNAAFCTGYRSVGTAIEAIIANGCLAAVGTNLISYKYNMP
jgi:parallel beta-helix repeat protein